MLFAKYSLFIYSILYEGELRLLHIFYYKEMEG